MSQNKIVSIKAHPKYRDIAALRKFLVEGQEDSGTKVDMERFIGSDNPEVQAQLLELNEWAKALQEMPSLQHAGNVGKSLSIEELMIPLGPLNPFYRFSEPPRDSMFAGGLRKGDFYNHAAIPPMPWDSPTPLHHMSRNANHITLDNRYMVKEPDDANPST